MKKLLSLALTFAMIFASLACVLTFGASASDTVSLPQCVGVQETKPVDNKQNIRFLSEVPQTAVTENITAFGYDVVATFQDAAGEIQNVSYIKEGNEVYTALNAIVEGTETLVEPKEGTYFFALSINNVPTNIGDIFFTVKTYTKVGEAKTYSKNEVQFCYVNGEYSQSKLVYVETFDKEVPTWKQGFDRKWGDAALLEVKEGKLNVNGGWTGFEIFDASYLQDVPVYTIETDIAFIGPELGAFSFIFNNDRDYDVIKAQNTMRGNCNMLSFRNVTAAGTFTATDANPMPTLEQLGCSMIEGIGTDTTMTQVTKVISGQVEAQKAGALACGFIQDAEGNALYANSFKLAIEVDCTNGIINMYVNGKLHASMENGVLGKSGGLWLMAQHSLVELDNLMVKTGTLNGGKNIPVSAVPAVEGTSVYAQDFNGDVNKTVAEVVADLGWSTIPLAGSSVDVVYTEDGMGKFTNKWGMSAFVEKEKMTNAGKYTLQASAKINAPAAGSKAVFNFAFNQDTDVAGFTKAGLDCVLLNFTSCGDNGAVADNGKNIGVSLVRYYFDEVGTTQVNVNGKHMLLDVAYGEQFDIRMDVDTEAQSIMVYVNDVLVLDYLASNYTDTKVITPVAGTIGIWVQGTTAYVDSLEVTNTTTAN